MMYTLPDSFLDQLPSEVKADFVKRQHHMKQTKSYGLYIFFWKALISESSNIIRLTSAQSYTTLFSNIINTIDTDIINGIDNDDSLNNTPFLVIAIQSFYQFEKAIPQSVKETVMNILLEKTWDKTIDQYLILKEALLGGLPVKYLTKLIDHSSVTFEPGPFLVANGGLESSRRTISAKTYKKDVYTQEEIDNLLKMITDKIAVKKEEGNSKRKCGSFVKTAVVFYQDLKNSLFPKKTHTSHNTTPVPASNVNTQNSATRSVMHTKPGDKIPQKYMSQSV